MQEHQSQTIVAINSGSSSLKFSLFADTDPLQIILSGKITGIGKDDCLFTIANADKQEILSDPVALESAEKAAELIIQWLQQQSRRYRITGIGHRVVHGGLQFQEPELIDQSFLKELKKLQSLSPLHLPGSISIMTIFLEAFPAVIQVACFDTAFHSMMPFEARHYAIPRNLWTEGIIRYGFHGISCEYIMHRLQQQDPAVNKKKIIIAHLGSGCSLTAVKEGSSVDTTMGFSPAGGLVMNTRAGDIDPGVIIYLQNKKKLKTEQLNILFNKEAGLKAIAETDHSMEQLLEEEKNDPRSKEAITMFCYYVKKQIGALAAAGGGLDSVVFTGGIGEHAASIRQLICRELDFMGIKVDEKLNEQQAEIISAAESKVQVYVIPANEEMMIAKHVKEYLLQVH